VGTPALSYRYEGAGWARPAPAFFYVIGILFGADNQPKTTIPP
jgi:hypothetical protein